MSNTGVKFQRALEKRRQEVRQRTGHDPCTCWDCLRKDGLTPPYPRRAKHPTYGSKPVVMNGTTDPELTGDPKGRPRPWIKHSQEEDKPKVEDAERAHLREAIKNREVI